MSEHMAAEISIGGRIPAAFVPPLCAAIAEQGVSLEWGGGTFRPQSGRDLLDACQDDGSGLQVLRLFDDQASWGEFAGLERFLREHDIAHRRRSDGKYEYDPELVEYRPGQESVVMTTNAAGKPVVAVSQLTAVETAIEQALAEARADHLGTATVRLDHALKAFREHLPSPIPDLEPFEIVSETAA